MQYLKQAYDYIVDFLSEQKDIFVSIIVLSIFSTFICDKYVTPTDSMYPTIQRNEFKIGTKYDYGYSSYSLSLVPIMPYMIDPIEFFSGRVLNLANPQRGDIISVYVPQDKIAYTKRIIGLPGDTVEIHNGKLIINDREITHQKVDDYLYLNKKYHQFIETLNNGVSYKVIFNPDLDNVDENLQAYKMRNMDKIVVPHDSYFLMGDNRDHSGDSRYDLGCVKKEWIISKIKYIIFSNETNIIDHNGSWFDTFVSMLDINKIFNWFVSIRFHRCFISVY
ncbi:MAG: signal peptidase I [Pseudomonadota bacterium]